MSEQQVVWLYCNFSFPLHGGLTLALTDRRYPFWELSQIWGDRSAMEFCRRSARATYLPKGTARLEDPAGEESPSIWTSDLGVEREFTAPKLLPYARL